MPSSEILEKLSTNVKPAFQSIQVPNFGISKRQVVDAVTPSLMGVKATIEERGAHLMRFGGDMLEKGSPVLSRACSLTSGEAKRLNEMQIATRNAVNVFRAEHPVEATYIGVGLVAVGSTIVLPAVTVAVLNAAGFTQHGVVAGTLAPVIQASVYGAFTCGMFSVAQSYAATATATSIPVVLCGVAALSSGAGSLLKRKGPDLSSSLSPQGPSADKQ